MIRFRTSLMVGLGALGAAVVLSMPASAQRGGMFHGSLDDPAIAYRTAAVDNVVADLNRKLADGGVTLKHEGRSGYLRSALDALSLPIDSQLLVHSKTSLQFRLISPSNPRALFFNDRAVLGWVRDGDVIEVAAHDRSLGIVFYTLEQTPSAKPEFKRVFTCLGCHMAGDSLGVPGLFTFSTMSASRDRAESLNAVDQRMPLPQRWGGWFVTGATGTSAHLGNRVPAMDERADRTLDTVAGLFEPDGYQSMQSDVAALLTFSHQTHMTNLLTRAAWEARASEGGASADVSLLMKGIAEEVVDYMLFVDEAPLPGGVTGTTGFAERVSAIGPFDRKGRTLHALDLQRRLLKYPCSYLIYAPAFDALPPAAKAPIYARLWQVLSGAERDPRYASALSATDRKAIVEILRDTKKDLPAYFSKNIRS